MMGKLIFDANRATESQATRTNMTKCGGCLLAGAPLSMLAGLLCKTLIALDEGETRKLLAGGG